MRISTLKVFVAVLLAGIAAASAETFVRPTVFYVDPTANGYSSAGAVGVQLGTQIGPRSEHEFAVEVAYARWESDVDGHWSSVSTREHYMPYLVSYRYYVGARDSIVRPFVGPSVGFMNSRVDVHVHDMYGYGGWHSDTSSDWKFAAAGTVGLAVRVSNRIDVEVAYRYLHADAGTYRINGATFTADAGKAHLFGGGVTIRF